MIIGISGHMRSGKDTVGVMIMRLCNPEYDFSEFGCYTNPWQIKKFADALKEIASILTGIPRADFEKEEVKNSNLGREWDKYECCFNLDKCRRPENKYMDYTEGSYECDAECVGYTTERSMTVRELLQKLGTDAIRNQLHTNAWVNALMSKYRGDSNWVVTDVRFPNEAEAIRERGGILIRLNRNIGSTSTHPSETALDNYGHFDYILDNNGTLEELEARVKSILQERNII